MESNITISSISWSQTQWDKILAYLGEDEFTIRVWATFIITIIPYWTFGSFFTLVDLTGWPKFMLKYKVQEDVKNYPITLNKLFDVIQVVCLNQMIALPLSCVAFYCNKYRGYVFETDRELPSLWTIITHLTISYFITEILFYYVHRLFHHPYFYKRFHKMHHTWISPIAISAAYCHPIEHTFCNAIPIIMGPFILQSHIIIWWLAFILANIETLTVHSGYHLPLLQSPEFHDYHHLKFNYNYGVNGLMDYIHGTNKQFRKSKEFIRHKRLWTTTPIKTLIP